MGYEYKTVPAPMVLNIKTEREAHQAIADFGRMINQEAVDGWEFYSMETITTSEAQGCGGSGSPKITNYNMLIFKKALPV